MNDGEPKAVPAVDPPKTHVVHQWKTTAPLISCRWHPQGKYVVAGVQDRALRRWEFPTGTETQLAGHDSWVRGLDFHPEGHTLYTGGYDGQLLFWPILDDKPVASRTIAAHAGWIRSVRVSPDGQTLATCGNDNLVKLWSTADGSLIRVLEGHQQQVYHAAFHPAGQHLASIDHHGIIKHWEISSGKELRELKAEDLHKFDTTFQADIGGARGMEFTPDGKWLVCGGITNVTNAFAGIGNPAVVLFDWEKGDKGNLKTPKAKYNASTWGLSYHPADFLVTVAGGGGGGFLLFYKFDAKEEFFQLKLSNTGRDMHLSPDLIHVAVAHHDSHLRIYSLQAPPPKAPAKK